MLWGRDGWGQRCGEQGGLSVTAGSQDSVAGTSLGGLFLGTWAARPACDASFHLQEIDGKALLLLRSDVMMKYMGLKLGPALKLSYHIDRLKQGKF